MVDEEKRFIRLGLEDIEIGRPLRFSLYDGNRQHIFRKGEVIPTAADAERIFMQGAYRVWGEAAAGEASPSLTEGANGAGESSVPSPRPSSRGGEATLENSHIRIGDPILLQTMPDAPKYAARLIGYLKNRSVIVTQPEIDGELIMLREGQAFTCRFFSGQNAFEFNTTINKQTSIPYPLLHLAYPRELRTQAVRRSPRVAVDLIAAIDVDAQASQYSGRIVDLGTAGAGLCTRTQIAQKDDRLRLKFKLAPLGIDTYIALDAQVRNVVRRDNDAVTPYFYGLHFVELDSNVQLALAAYVFGQALDDL